MMDRYKIVWQHPDIKKPENRDWPQRFFFAHEVKVFSDIGEAADFFATTSDNWILLISGSNGYELANRVYNSPNLLGIVIFIGPDPYDMEWAQNFPLIKVIKGFGFKPALDEIKNIWNRYVTSSALQAVPNPSAAVGQLISAINPNHSSESQVKAKKNYYHWQDELEMGFLQLCKLTMKTSQINRQAVFNELLCLLQSQNKRAKLENKYSRYPNDLLKSFVTVYSSNLIYNQLNDCYASNNYKSVVNITTACVLQLKDRYELKLPPGRVLYRGANIPEEDLKSYQVGKTGFWSAFTSTSKERAVARSPAFGGNVLFRIQLSKKNAHPHMCIEDWSVYPDEKEVLLLPYFPLVIKSIQLKQSSGGNYTEIKVKQDKNHPSLAFNNEILINYWRGRIENEISIPVNNYCQRIREKVANSVDLLLYFKSAGWEHEDVPQFEKDLRNVIKNCYNKNKACIEESMKSSEDSSSLFTYWGVMKSDIEDSIIDHITANIEKVFEFEFERIKKNIVKIISNQAFTSFYIPHQTLKEATSSIFHYAGGVSFTAQPKALLEEFKKGDSGGYLDTFINAIVKIMKSAVMIYENSIKLTTEKLRGELRSQLETLEGEIKRSLESVLL
ncbi:unnamed protein product [Blepharisma stoltei]|uniref:NAD(P)(+)--arginine ADP-ribosyltransferase n=1 Tax=Blepharisma stoltei TaxID=1481888 RepID=A0AAU9IG87_9CILI|nr:unnamed protein product [Blepharisma stoltei]